MSLIVAVLVAAIVWLPQIGSADGGVAVHLDEGLRQGEPVTHHYAVLEDPGGELSFEDARAASFEAAAGVPSYGFSSSTYWFRLDAHNPTASAAPWLLEIGYPHLDHVELFAPQSDGSYAHTVTGDRLPFAERPVENRNFVFRVDTPPGTATYYLRVSSSGPVNVPMTAWDVEGFAVSLDQRAPMLWMFYGLMLALMAYNLFIYFAVGDYRYLIYVAYLACYVLFQFTLNGFAYQYLWPGSPEWANRFIGLSIGLAFLFGVYFSRLFLEARTHFPRYDRVYAWVTCAGALASVAASQLAPVWLSIRVAVIVGIGSVVAILPIALSLFVKRQRQARYYIVAWATLLTGILCYLLKSIGLLPSNTFTEWTIQFGAALEVLLLSLGLADRINVLRRDVSEANTALQANVAQLTAALEQAEAARKAKSVFLASVSHELRTPLNAIINIPEGLLEQFQQVHRAQCGTCESVFDLDDDETVDAGTECPECTAQTLRQQDSMVYAGEARATHDHLEHVHRAGQHLLQVVGDILDISKLEAGRMTVELQRVQLQDVVDDALGPMRSLAAQQGVDLHFAATAEERWVNADPLKLKQVVLNLVSNAIKFSEGRGQVRVTVDEETETYRIGVHDEGTGIASADKDKLFAAFVQAESAGNRRFGGTGLGLAISKRLVEAHQGEIWFESEYGEGASFFVRIPKASQDSTSKGVYVPRDVPVQREVHG